MPIDTSMYQNFRGGLGLSSLAQGVSQGLDIANQFKSNQRQAEQAARQAEQFQLEKDALQIKRNNELYTQLGPMAGELLAIKDPVLREQKYGEWKNQLIQAGVAKENELPQKFGFAEPLLTFSFAKHQKAQAEEKAKNDLERRFKESQINKYNAEARGGGLANNKPPTGYRFQPDGTLAPIPGGPAASGTESLPLDKKKMIETLATKNASKISIKNQIDAVTNNWDNLTDDQKVAAGRQLLKTLNSTEGADAIGVEEAGRLGGKIEFALGNLFNSNPVQFGRDLEGFKTQAENISKAISTAIKSNQGEIDQAFGRKTAAPKLETQIYQGITYVKQGDEWVPQAQQKAQGNK